MTWILTGISFSTRRVPLSSVYSRWPVQASAWCAGLWTQYFAKSPRWVPQGRQCGEAWWEIFIMDIKVWLQVLVGGKGKGNYPACSVFTLFTSETNTGLVSVTFFNSPFCESRSLSVNKSFVCFRLWPVLDFWHCWPPKEKTQSWWAWSFRCSSPDDTAVSLTKELDSLLLQCVDEQQKIHNLIDYSAWVYKCP